MVSDLYLISDIYSSRLMEGYSYFDNPKCGFFTGTGTTDSEGKLYGNLDNKLQRYLRAKVVNKLSWWLSRFLRGF